MDLGNVKPNSHTYKQQQEDDDIPKTGKVIQGKVLQKERAGRKRFADLFITEDIGNVKEYLIYDLLVPTLKDTIVDVIQKSTEMLFYGKIKGGRRTSGVGNASYVSYNSYSKPIAQGMTPRSNLMYSFDDIYLEDRSEAQQVLDVLLDIIDQYGKVTVADYYDAVGVTGHGYTDRSYGWTDLRQAWISSDRNGYIINMPRCIELKVVDRR